LQNGLQVSVLDRAVDRKKQAWVYVGHSEDQSPIGWVYREFIACAVANRDDGPEPKPLFTADQEACFGRVYDRTHLASHPQQKVTGIHNFRYLSERPEAEDWRADQRADLSRSPSVQAFITFNDRPGYFHNWLMCPDESKNGVHCFVECGGGSFDMKRESPTTALLYNHG
jgi:hypothetical protein